MAYPAPNRLSGTSRPRPVSTAQPAGWPAKAASPPATRPAMTPTERAGTQNSANCRAFVAAISAHHDAEAHQAVEQHAEIEHRTESDDQVPDDPRPDRFGQQSVVHQEQHNAVGAHREGGEE